MKSKPNIRLNHLKESVSAGLRARRIWQALFNHIYKEFGHLDDMGDFLCDYNWMQSRIQNYINSGEWFDSNFSFSFYFYCNGSYTEITDYPNGDFQTKITVSKDFTFLEFNQED